MEGVFSVDGYVDSYDVVSWDWVMNAEDRLLYDCGVPLVGEGIGTTSGAATDFDSSAGQLPRAVLSSNLSDLLIAGKRGTDDAANTLKDRLYVFDSNGLSAGWFTPAAERCNIRLVQDLDGKLYQLNSETGLLRLDDPNIVVIPPGEIELADINEPRYNNPATVYVGIQGEGPDSFGRPILDAAFDEDYVYVVPVVVSPTGLEPYTAAAKLQLLAEGSPPYQVIQLYDDPPLPGNNQYRNAVREIELDNVGNLYVVNAHGLNESNILWKYGSDGTVLKRLDLGNPNSGSYLPNPIAMHMSDSTDTLYLTSGQYDQTDIDSTVVYGFATNGALELKRSITISGIQHVTGITEDPATGTLWVVGFTMQDIPRYPNPFLSPFYHPYLAKIPCESDIVQGECSCGMWNNDLALPMSILWTGDPCDVPDSERIIYVDGLATGANDGSSWTDAYNYLQDALTAASSGDEIWVAQGIYKPDQGVGITPGDREATFQLISAVTTKGGYAGLSEPDPNDRDISVYKTVLSGDLNGNDVGDLTDPSRNDNTYHVITASYTWLTTVLDGFTITAGNAPDDEGGGMRIFNGRATIRNCIISGNSASSGGGIYCGSIQNACCLSRIRLGDCNITSNAPNGIYTPEGAAEIVGVVHIASNDWVGNDLMIYGNGTLRIQSDAALDLDNSTIRCDLSGPGSMYVGLDSELVIEADATIDLGHETDPSQNGTIQCDGLLRVRDSVHLSNATINVTRASFEGDVDISYSVIIAEAGAPYGQFFIEDTVTITGNDIHADGDRYMDLDPSVFAGVIANNRIYVTITEGQNNTRGGLLELRGDPDFADPLCDPGEFLCQIDSMPDFNSNTWTIEQLELVEGAKVNLTNRFDFGNGGLYEVMYVKQLVLGPDCVLNTAFNQLYYENLFGDPNSVIDVPLLGFSLNNIAC
ncbi:MAG: hypothetical protein ACYS21_09970, partial [Planctomycetota bacterium]